MGSLSCIFSFLDESHILFPDTSWECGSVLALEAVMKLTLWWRDGNIEWTSHSNEMRDFWTSRHEEKTDCVRL
jgi:hypothetical protein